MTRIVIVNEHDEIIGYRARNAILGSDIYRFTGLWITNSKHEILLAQRKFTKKHDPGKWGPAAAGTVEVGETYDSNVVKEAEEEIGLKNFTPNKGPKQRFSSEYNYFCQWYTFVIDKPAEAFTIQEDEVERLKWFSTDELHTEIARHPKDYIKNFGSILEILKSK